MQTGSKEFIRNLIDSKEGLSPVLSDIKPEYRQDTSIKACLFDIYGTLLMSSSGDINTTHIKSKNLKKAFDATGIALNHSFRNEHAVLSMILDIFRKIILHHHEESRRDQISHPEIEIREIWAQVLKLAQNKEYIYFDDDLDITYFSLVFELVNNLVSPMPGMMDVITELHNKKMPTGIVSNAQFYTPVIMNYFITGQLNNSDTVVNFNDDLQFFSYKYKRAKPDTFLFDLVVPVLNEKYGIKPHETLFVGNDMLKDVLPAQRSGIKTVLFAGDKRSLRLRKDDNKIKAVKPDYTITELKQIFEIL